VLAASGWTVSGCLRRLLTLSSSSSRPLVVAERLVVVVDVSVSPDKNIAMILRKSSRYYYNDNINHIFNYHLFYFIFRL